MQDVIKFKFKSPVARKNFIKAGKTNKFIVDNYLNLGILHTDNFYQMEGFLSRYIVKDELIVDEVNIIEFDELEEYFEVWEPQTSPTPEPVKPEKTLPTVSDDEIMWDIIGRELGIGDVKETPSTTNTATLTTQIKGYQPATPTCVFDNIKKQNPVDLMIVNLLSSEAKSNPDLEYKMTIVKGREGKQCLQLKIEW